MKNDLFEKWCTATTNKGIKLSVLRKDILSILFHKNKPMGAYEILENLKKKRSNAEPPTVYRVLKWLVEVNLIHRIESKNAYVFCSVYNHDTTSHQTILLICRECHKSYEISDNGIARAIKKCIVKYKINIDNNVIEMTGVCAKCLARISSG